uniref:type II secretion system protein N n=1 Tax=Pelomonas sp. KK5 TaxID=1855730 RepID=UPI00097C3CED
ARGLATASGGRVLITDTRGSIWNGSGLLVLAGGAESRDAASLPDRLHWQMSPQGLGGLRLSARQDCCINGELQLRIKPGFGRTEIAIDGTGKDWLLRWPAAVLAGLGTPWNTLQLGGTLRLQAQALQLDEAGGQWRQTGRLDVDLLNLSSRVSTLDPLGSYRMSLVGAPDGKGGSLQLSTLEGALLLSGQGGFGTGRRVQFRGEATAAPGREAALDNLLNIIGRRQGARSVISIG